MGFIYVLDVVDTSYLAIIHGKFRESYDTGTGVSKTFNGICGVVKEKIHFELEATRSKPD